MVTAIRINSPGHFKLIIIIVWNIISQVDDVWGVQSNEGEEWKKRAILLSKYKRFCQRCQNQWQKKQLSKLAFPKWTSLEKMHKWTSSDGICSSLAHLFLETKAVSLFLKKKKKGNW